MGFWDKVTSNQTPHAEWSQPVDLTGIYLRLLTLEKNVSDLINQKNKEKEELDVENLALKIYEDGCKKSTRFNPEDIKLRIKEFINLRPKGAN